METVILRKDMAAAAELIRSGALVAVPTETVYGLAGNALDESAVRQIYEVKGRPEIKPLSIMVPGPGAVELYAEDVPRAAKTLAERFWPGPLTIVLKAKQTIPPLVLAGGSTVGLRCPDHPLTLEALRLAGLPFAAPSANPSGQPSPKNAKEVLGYFDGQIAAVIDGGPCGLGRESTILDMSAAPYRVLRQGALPEKDIHEALISGLKRVGITGPTGCGKSTALEQFRRHGALVIDCDRVYHELLETEGPMLRALRERFPTAFDGDKLDRKALGALVFADAEALKELNGITHRHICQAVRRRMRDWALQGGHIVAIDASELIGSELAAECSVTAAVLAEPEVRLRRILARDGISRDYALSRIRAQKPDAYFRQNCDRVLENNGDLDAFIAQCEQWIKEIEEDG